MSPMSWTPYTPEYVRDQRVTTLRAERVREEARRVLGFYLPASDITLIDLLTEALKKKGPTP